MINLDLNSKSIFTIEWLYSSAAIPHATICSLEIIVSERCLPSLSSPFLLVLVLSSWQHTLTATDGVLIHWPDYALAKYRRLKIFCLLLHPKGKPFKVNSCILVIRDPPQLLNSIGWLYCPNAVAWVDLMKFHSI